MAARASRGGMCDEGDRRAVWRSGSLALCILMGLGCTLDERTFGAGMDAPEVPDAADPADVAYRADAAAKPDASLGDTGGPDASALQDGSTGLGGDPRRLEAGTDGRADATAQGRAGAGGNAGADSGTANGGAGGQGGGSPNAGGGTGGAGTATTTAPPVDPRTVPPGAPDQSSPFGCSEVSTAWKPTTYCHIQNNGYDKNGNPQADVGDTAVWIYWAKDSVSGWICMDDDQPNSRGLNFRVLLHKREMDTTMPASAFISAGGAFVEVYKDSAPGNACNWVAFSGLDAGGFDSVVVEWEDSWVSGAGEQTTHYDGRSVARAPASL